MAKDRTGSTGAVRSMTGFASRAGALGPVDWTWEVRGVNGRGLDLRLRLPDRIDGLEAEVRKRTQAKLSRGNVSIGLRMARSDAAAEATLDTARLRQALAILAEVQATADAMGLGLRPPSAAEVAGMRGVVDTGAEDEDQKPLRDAMLADFDVVLGDFDGARESEGSKLHSVLSDQVSRIEALAARAREEAARRPEAQRESLTRALSRLREAGTGVDEGRLAQELALIAVKTDVTEELDRLDAHVAQAREHLAAGGPIGRKLDFLMQEFNREANTLCSKAQAPSLTAVGLDLKTVIDQMREQVQNVE